MDYPMRAIRPDEFEKFAKATEVAFSSHSRAEELEAERLVFEPDRSLAVFDGEAIVATAAALSFRMTLPGGELPTAGVTSVGVLPTHRRRGMLTAMMRRQLDDVRGRSEPLAALFASESVIYGRYGYGIAAPALHLTVDKRRSGFGSPVASDAGDVRLIDKDAVPEAFAPVYERVRPEQPGMHDRPSPDAWRHRFSDPEHHRDGGSALFFALFESARGVDGYVAYRFKHDWADGVPEGLVGVEELVAATSDAYAGLWRFCLDIDLASKLEAWNRPMDEPLLLMMADSRRARAHMHDALWVRLVDVAEALAGRRYATEGTLTIEVHDQFCPWNEGRYRLNGGPEDAECRPTNDRPDLELSAADLAAVYLGGVKPSRLARAGRVRELADGALGRADAMLGWDRAPWCPDEF
jgi:predicted acetyltransferase